MYTFITSHLKNIYHQIFFSASIRLKTPLFDFMLLLYYNTSVIALQICTDITFPIHKHLPSIDISQQYINKYIFVGKHSILGLFFFSFFFKYNLRYKAGDNIYFVIVNKSHKKAKTNNWYSSVLQSSFVVQKLLKKTHQWYNLCTGRHVPPLWWIWVYFESIPHTSSWSGKLLITAPNVYSSTAQNSSQQIQYLLPFE